MREDEPLAVELVTALRSGDIGAVRVLLDVHPGLARQAIASGRGPGGRTPLHVVTDWPGYFPNGPAIARMLLGAGANPDTRTEGQTGETPLHWAASSDDADVAAVLIDGGAGIEVPDGSIGTPLDNAIGYACWNVARLLVERGARVERLWHAAALGMTARLAELLAASPPSHADVNQAFYHACDGGQRRCAELLLGYGADVNFAPEYGGPPLDAAGNLGTQRNLLIEWLRARGARPRPHRSIS
jgi:uncharacterized protein